MKNGLLLLKLNGVYIEHKHPKGLQQISHKMWLSQ